MEHSPLPENQGETTESQKRIPEKAEQQTNTNLTREDKFPKGWLSFFLFTVVIGAAFSIFSNLSNFSMEAYDSGQGKMLTYTGILCDIIQLGGCLLLAIYTTYAFIKNRPNAVSLGKMYLISLFACNALLLWFNSIGENFDADGLGGMTQIIRSLIYTIVWFLYLTYSIQVEDLFPKETRVTKVKDIIFCIIPPLLSLLYFCLILMMVDY